MAQALPGTDASGALYFQWNSCKKVGQFGPLTFIKAGQRLAPYLGSAMNTEVIDVDARGLEPPQPMVRILEALATLPAGKTLRARTDRRPVHLYPLIEERGFRADTQPEPDGSFVTHIRRD